MTAPRTTKARPAQVAWSDADVQRPGEEIEPFPAEVDGKVLTFSDPRDVAWQDIFEIAETGRLAQIFNYVLSKEDLKHLANTRMEGWKLNNLIEAYFSHFKFELPDPTGKRERDRI